MITTDTSSLAEHKKRYKKLIKLRDLVSYAMLGEETDMIYEYKRIYKKTIDELKIEWETIQKLEASK